MAKITITDKVTAHSLLARDYMPLRMPKLTAGPDSREFLAQVTQLSSFAHELLDQHKHILDRVSNNLVAIGFFLDATAKWVECHPASAEDYVDVEALNDAREAMENLRALLVLAKEAADG